MRSRRILFTASAAALILAATACSGGGRRQSTGGDGPAYTIAMITHEQPGTALWDRVRTGAEQAAKQHNITLKYANDPDQAKQATLVQNAIDSKVDGIAATLAFPEAVGPALAKASQAGIPTVALNAGLDVYQKYGALMYFGSDENLAGESAGKRIADAGSGKALCVVHAEGVISLEARCAGVKKSFPTTENVQVNGADLASVTSTLQAKLAEDKDITHIVTLDAGVATGVMKAKEQAGSTAKIVTFDLNNEVVQAIKNKTIEFCVDQQPYLQGYEAVDTLWLQLTNGNDLGGGQAVLTGPSFVDSSNIDKIAIFAEKNTR
ncbi:substrate-binding domain-containing protein [Actinoplanes sp. LDG1-06]|uniref:Substrate-binding domain-containing protein n=1 Tax=Paractinoplanes ovalisporus TaxID=2810368 RepID=A0ABS2AR81_9ACTN|nr:substrate-binding domain-containing protein [Actinoplanes ovalisporus]MBM2622365.1 substrate-binding domain-containing protein [Actinoplanes ovalisporus]